MEVQDRSQVHRKERDEEDEKSKEGERDKEGDGDGKAKKRMGKRKRREMTLSKDQGDEGNEEDEGDEGDKEDDGEEEDEGEEEDDGEEEDEGNDVATTSPLGPSILQRSSSMRSARICPSPRVRFAYPAELNLACAICLILENIADFFRAYDACPSLMLDIERAAHTSLSFPKLRMQRINSACFLSHSSCQRCISASARNH